VYTKIDDMRMAQKILLYIDKNPSATRKEIMHHCFTNMRRLRQLEADGYLTIPLPTPRGIRNKEYYENKAIQSTNP
jgi:hypothetical protein